MKKQLQFKKLTNSVILTWIMMIILLASVKTSQGQTVYQTIFWDNHTSGSNVPYCLCDSIKCVPPAGATGISWVALPPKTYHGDTLILPSGYNDNVTCIYNSTSKMLQLRPTAIPISPNFPTVDTVCGVIDSMLLDANNYSQYGFTNYSWNNGATSQTIAVAPQSGVHWVNISNVCGSVSDTITIVKYNPNHPNLGPDVVKCQGDFVLLDPGTGYSNYLWTPGNSTASSLMSTISGTYIVQTTNAVGGCVDRDTIQITFLIPPAQAICYVEFDTATHKNRIVWAAPPANADSIKIYSEVSTNVYDIIGTVPASQTYYVDSTSNPQNASNSYKIAVLDTCFNVGSKSDYHKTITLLSAYDQPTNTYGFSWSAYEGLTVPNYNIYGLTANNQSTLIGTVPGNSFFYNYPSPSPLFVKYYVAFLTPTCSSKTDYLVKSNYVASVTSGINELTIPSLKVYPNPAQDIVRIYGSFGGTLRLLDITGLLVLEQVNKDGYINISTLAKGSYILELRSDKGILKTKLFKE